MTIKKPEKELPVFLGKSNSVRIIKW